MKKRILFLAAIFTLSLVACGSKEEQEKKENKEDDKEAIEEISEASNNYKILALDDYDDERKLTNYIVDGQETVLSFSPDYGKDMIESLGYDVDDSGFQLIGSDGELLYYNLTEYVAESENVEHFFAINPKTDEINEFYSDDSGDSFRGFDYYKGEVYLLFDGYSQEPNKRELIFTRKDNSLDFDCRDSELTDFFKKIDDIFMYGGFGNNYQSPERCFDEYGVYVATVDNGSEGESLISFDKTGNKESLLESENNIALEYFNDKYVVYGEDVDGDYNYALHILKIADKSVIDIPDSENASISGLGLKDDCVYYKETITDAYGQYSYILHRYNIETGDNDVIVSSETIPGTGVDFAPGITGFTFSGDYIYTLDLEGSDIVWKRADSTVDTLKFENTNNVYKTINSFSFGDVRCNYYETCCENCGIPLYSTYVENFELNPEYSDFATEINNALYMDVSTEEVDEYIYEEEEYHLDSPEQYHTTDDLRIYDANIINDQFLTVEYHGYYYSGGAHGYPTQYQRIFDLTTGEELGLFDFYSGTEEELKEYLAQKTVEDFESYGDEEYSPYFGTTSEEIYDSAYENLAIESINIIWGQDSATLLYSPYAMGPYASGYIKIELPYDEFIGNDTLVRQ